MAAEMQNAEAMLPILERIIAAELAADEADQDIIRDNLADVRDELSAQLCDLKAETPAGAALQIAVAMYYAELTRGCILQVDRDAYHTRQEALLQSALGVIGGDLPPGIWTAFVGWKRPTRTQSGFCVQTFIRPTEALMAGEKRRYSSATEAEEVAARIAPHVAGVMVRDANGELIATHGEVLS